MSNYKINDIWYNRFLKEAVPEINKFFKPKNLIIFGSRVKGKANKISDIDVIIVSDIFKELRFLQRMPYVLKKVKFEKHVDYLCYTPQELNEIKKTSFIVKEAIKEGIDILK